jgi:hypothetical protein
MARQPAVCAQSATGFEEGHQLTLVVGRAARHDLPAVRLRFDEGGREGVGRPQIQRIDRLHVVMAVEQHMGGIRAGRLGLGDDHRVACGRPRRGLEAEVRQLPDQPAGGGRAVRRIGRIGGNGLSAQQREQAVERALAVGVERGERFIEIGHVGSCLIRDIN